MLFSSVCQSALSLVGRVVSQGQMTKTAKVLVTRHVRHPLVEKVVKKRKTYLVRLFICSPRARVRCIKSKPLPGP